VAFLEEGKQIIVDDSESRLTIWDWQSGEKIPVDLNKLGESVQKLSFFFFFFFFSFFFLFWISIHPYFLIFSIFSFFLFLFFFLKGFPKIRITCLWLPCGCWQRQLSLHPFEQLQCPFFSYHIVLLILLTKLFSLILF